MEPHRIKGIYLRFDSPSNIGYKLPDRDDVYKARFQNCKFIETRFPSARHSNHIELNFRDQETLTLNPVPRTAITDSELKKLLDLHNLAEKLSDGFHSRPTILQNPLLGSGNPVSASILKKRKTYTRAALLVEQSKEPSDP